MTWLSFSWQVWLHQVICRYSIIIPAWCCPALLTTLSVLSIRASGKMALLSSDKQSHVTMRQIGGTTGVFCRSRYDNTAQQRAAGQKTSCHQAKLNHMESFFFFYFFIFFHLRALNLLCSPSRFKCSDYLPIATKNLTCQKVVVILDDMYFTSLYQICSVH